MNEFNSFFLWEFAKFQKSVPVGIHLNGNYSNAKSTYLAFYNISCEKKSLNINVFTFKVSKMKHFKMPRIPKNFYLHF